MGPLDGFMGPLDGFMRTPYAFPTFCLGLLLFPLLSLAQNNGLQIEVPQESGYIQVREGCHMFFWLFRSLHDNPTDPLIVWLQGGPGSSAGGYGNFMEIGPWFRNGTRRRTAWNSVADVLFIDSPVGTGYSFVNNPGLLTRNIQQISEDLVAFLRRFFRMFPILKASPLYFFCESYGGKVAVHLAQQLLNRHRDLIVDLRGIVLGNSWLSPGHYVVTWPNFLYNQGFVDESGLLMLEKHADRIIYLMLSGQTRDAHFATGAMQSMIKYLTAGVGLYGVQKKFKFDADSLMLRREMMPMLRSEDGGDALDALMNGPIKQWLDIPEHVQWKFTNEDVFLAHKEDYMVPVTDIVEDLLNRTNLDIVVLNGNQDLLIPTVGVSEWLNSLRWSLSSQWTAAPRVPIVFNGVVEGYNKTLGRLKFYTLQFAGHMLNGDNPEAGFKLMKHIIGADTPIGTARGRRKKKYQYRPNNFY